MKNLFDYEKTQSATVDLPFGAFKNESAPGQQNGTDIVAEHIQDLAYPLYQVLQLAGITPDGELEDGNNKTQFIQALTNIGILRYSDKSVYNKSVFVWNIVGNDFTLYRSKKAENNAGLEDTSSWLKVLEIGSDDKINFNVETNIIADESIKTYMPPGVLEVPQNIKYTLNNGTFTLKAGSILTVPYGTTDQSATYPVGATFLNNNFKVADTSFYSGKFFVMAEVQADISISSTNVSDIDTFLIVNLPGNSLAYYQQPRCKSGTTQPTGADLWYNTSTNRFLNIQDTATQINYSFPIVAIRRDSGTVDSVLRVFNGFGYFGKAVWINKGVTTLCPNGKNTDGTNNNMVKTSDEVFTLDITSTGGTFLLLKGQANNAIRFSVQHYISQSKPQLSSATATWYNPALNYMFMTNNTGASWEQSSFAPVGVLRLEDSVFRAFDDATDFVAADDNAVVHNYGNEEINGVKTFNDAMTANSTITVYDEILSYTNTNQWQGVLYKNLALDITNPPAIAYGGRLISYDKNGVYFGASEHGFSNNTMYNRMRAHKVVNGVDKLSDVAAYIDNSGNCYGVAPTYTANYADSSGKIVTTAYMANHWTTSKPTTSSTASKARPFVGILNYLSGTEGAVKLSDGLIIQWGSFNPDNYNNNQNVTITYKMPFSNSNYSLSCTRISQRSTASYDVENMPQSKSSTGFVIEASRYIRLISSDWFAIGY